MTVAELEAIIDGPTSVVLVARVDDHVVGMLTLVTFAIPSGLRAWIEDVVVDDQRRGTGVGKALTLAAINHARTMGARSVDLTSRPSREVANRLYVKLGFQRRDTNVYRLSL